MRLSLLGFVAILLSTATRTNAYGEITAPVNGAHLQPGQPFAFSYNAHIQYCWSSHNITALLLTNPPSPSGGYSGRVLGRFATGSYPAQGLPNPNPPSPPQLVTPDFSLRPGGFGTGKAVSNLPMFFAVIEEWNSCEPTIGNVFNIAWNKVVYNSKAN